MFSFNRSCSVYTIHNRLYNRLDNRLDVCMHDTTCCPTGCQTGMTTGCIVYRNIHPVVKPVSRPFWQQVVSCIEQSQNSVDSEILKKFRHLNSIPSPDTFFTSHCSQHSSTAAYTESFFSGHDQQNIGHREDDAGDNVHSSRELLRPLYNFYKNSSGYDIANVNFCAVRPEATRIRRNNAK